MEKDYAQIRAEAKSAETKAMRKDAVKFLTISIVVVILVLTV